ncbi:MAG: hypothetical protein ACE5EE_10765 [Fidelibacterota bacterium]
MDPSYFALFYVVGIICFAVFIRFWLGKKRFREEEKKLNTLKKSPRVYEEMARKITEDAKEHRRRLEDDSD